VQLIAEMGEKVNSDPNKLADSFAKHVRIFMRSKLCRHLKMLVSKLFHAQQVNKIVAFGLGPLSLGLPGGPDDPGIVRIHIQHAALLAMRDVWKEMHQGDLKIYVQDPQYLEMDLNILAHHGITVVNGDIGHQMGACLLDPLTLVVDFFIMLANFAYRLRSHTTCWSSYICST